MRQYDLQSNEVLMVGDAVVDIKAARAVGVRSAAVVWDSYTKSQVLDMKPDLVFNSTDEILAWTRDTFPE
jgi:phosphoglycolate phosphatase-like HAD superfamily hydrolase